MRLHRLGAGLAVALSAWAALAVAASAEAAATAEQIKQGRIVYEDNCETCHGRNMANPAPAAFDLRTFPRSDAARFRDAVLHGKGTAMPAFEGRVSDDEITLLWAYLRGGS